MEKVLVTGGTGFLAGWVIRKLLAKGYCVRTTVRAENRQAVILKMLHSENVATGSLSFAVCDLNSPKGWDTAMEGIDKVLHLASPLGSGNQDDSALISIAERGVNHVIRAALKARVKKIVMTSSEAACYPEKSSRNPHINEEFWTDLNNPNLTSYMRSKAVAERRAWELVRHQSLTSLTTILPGAIMGPSMGGRRSSTDQIFEMILKGMPSPKAIYPVVDVRDLADLHLSALGNPLADNQRFIAESEEITMPAIARLMKQTYPDYHISTMTIPNWLVSLSAKFNPAMKTLNTMTGLHYHHDHSKAVKLLGWQPRPVKQTVLDSVNYLIAISNSIGA